MRRRTRSPTPRPRPVIFGEVLYDCFADRTVLGGAPFNVAWHLRGFGLDPLLLSRIGEDALGAGVVDAMDEWGMDLSGLQRDPRRPTGQVRVALEAGQPRFDILPDQAYDHVDWREVEPLLERDDLALLYHGTLALRRAPQRAAFTRLRAACGLNLCVDVNLRAPWWRRDQVLGLTRGAACLKLNAAELTALAHGSAAGAGPGDGDPAVAARAFAERMACRVLVVTRGDLGATAVIEGQPDVRVAAVRAGEVVDTVGAGDAFSSVLLLGALREWPWPQTLARAAEFAALACGHRGALNDDAGMYARLLAGWGDA